MNDLVSIIMPSYNTSMYIGDTIKSVLAQTYTNWELLIVDDCSTDDTYKVVSLFNDLRIHYFKNNYNKGAALSRNYALKKAQGRWIAFLDSDDIWFSEKLEKQIQFMEKFNYHFSYTEYENIDEQSKTLNIITSGPQIIDNKKMLQYCWPGCLTIMYDSKIIGLVQILDIKRNNDYALWLKISKKEKCYLLKEVLAQYRKRKGSISNHSYFKMIKWHYLLFFYNENQNLLFSILYTIQNMFFGCLKKIFYCKKIR